ncbi:MAG TPA: rubrerythrin family protein [bacterium]|nr:rubrerythrin family protein [bacterium]
MGKTIENLVKAFVGESQARNRYTMYSSIARKEGYEQISAIFAETADNETEHAEWFFRMANELNKASTEKLNEMNVEAAAPLISGDTAENLKAAVAGEHFEASVLYPEFADIAESEGHKEMSVRIRAISVSEAHHEARYKELLQNVEQSSVFKKGQKVYWICRKCGYVYEGTEPPASCPSCGHAESYFQVLVEKY